MKFYQFNTAVFTLLLLLTHNQYGAWSNSWLNTSINISKAAIAATFSTIIYAHGILPLYQKRQQYNVHHQQQKVWRDTCQHIQERYTNQATLVNLDRLIALQSQVRNDLDSLIQASNFNWDNEEEHRKTKDLHELLKTFAATLPEQIQSAQMSEIYTLYGKELDLVHNDQITKEVLSRVIREKFGDQHDHYSQYKKALQSILAKARSYNINQSVINDLDKIDKTVNYFFGDTIQQEKEYSDHKDKSEMLFKAELKTQHATARFYQQAQQQLDKIDKQSQIQQKMIEHCHEILNGLILNFATLSSRVDNQTEQYKEISLADRRIIHENFTRIQQQLNLIKVFLQQLQTEVHAQYHLPNPPAYTPPPSAPPAPPGYHPQ